MLLPQYCLKYKSALVTPSNCTLKALALLEFQIAAAIALIAFKLAPLHVLGALSLYRRYTSETAAALTNTPTSGLNVNFKEY